MIRPEFDAAYYLLTNKDVAEAQIDPLEHFTETGWREGRDPNADFSVRYYLDSNPDIRAAGVNPFLHYVQSGRREGRFGRRPGGYKVERLQQILPLEERVKRWCSQRQPAALLDASAITGFVRDAAGDRIRTLILAVGHDNYRTVSGGVQVCIQREEEVAAWRGAMYLNLHPFQTLPRLAHASEDSDVAVNLMLNGEEMGVARMTELIAATKTLACEIERIEVVVHHLLGHLPEQVVEMVLAAGHRRCWLWIHDFFTVCPSFALQRNDLVYCDAPAPSSNACKICLYGEERTSHISRMRAFFEALDVELLSPSEVAAEIWSSRSTLSAKRMQLHPHIKLSWETSYDSQPAESNKTTVAFAGTALPHKGWHAFDRLVTKLQSGGLYRFLYFGSGPPPRTDVQHFPVHVTKENPIAMINALRAEQVDLVLHWASWPETFSLSTYEAIAAGAYVLTNPVSGNVAATVARLGRGAVLADEADLEAFFIDGRAQALATELRAERRSSVVHHVMSEMTFDALKDARN